MELNINSPMYYKDIYGIDNEIYELCQSMHLFFKEKKYSNIIDVVGLIPIIAPQDVIGQGQCKEKKFCSVTYGFADVHLFIDYNAYVNADIEGKKKLMIENVLESIKVIKGKGKIDYKEFENDMKLFCTNNHICLE